ncbi:MAG: tRNA pseudouridine(55) synthase TruB [Mycoplasma sp.]
MQKNNYNLFIIDKPLNITSNKLIQHIKKECNIKKIGHGGTLDPMASGVMIIGINNGTKNLTNQLNETKEYISEIEFGYTTDTYDLEGEVTARKEMHISIEQIIACCEKFKNESYEQEVPMYSAVKVNGKELYKHARNGNVIIDLPKKSVNLIDYEIISFKNNLLKIRMNVSKGFYIRSFANDIGKNLDGFATLISLRRTRSGEFKIEDALTPKDFIEKYKSKKLINEQS